jgi:hypothetical protein
MRKIFCVISLSFLISASVFADPGSLTASTTTTTTAATSTAIPDPCTADQMLNLIDRPTAADAACAMPYNSIMIEAGYQHLKISHGGQGQNFPETEVRFGLPMKNEISVLLPNYTRQGKLPHSGFTASAVGFKHQIGYNEKWLGSVESIVTLPMGSTGFGSNGMGLAINGIVSYNATKKLNLTLLFGIASLTQSSYAGGQRFTTVNPDLVATYTLFQKLDVYLETFGQSRTGPNSGSGFNFDGGLIYQVAESCVLDFEGGQRISGSLGGYDHYLGTGVSIEI